jgi:hypothetical protein
LAIDRMMWHRVRISEILASGDYVGALCDQQLRQWKRALLVLQLAHPAQQFKVHLHRTVKVLVLRCQLLVDGEAIVEQERK